MSSPSVHNVAARYLHAVLTKTSSASDAHHRIVLRDEINGARDLRATMLDLAASAAETSRGPIWVLATRIPRMGVDRVAAEWHRMTALLRPDLASRIGMVAFAADGVAMQPDNLGVRD